MSEPDERPKSCRFLRADWILCCTFCSTNQYCPWMERHWCSERPSSSVWVAVEVTVAKVSHTGRACCTTEPLGRTEQLSFGPVLLAVSFFGLARSGCCLSGLLSSEPADFAAVLLAATVFGRARSHFFLVCACVAWPCRLS